VRRKGGSGGGGGEEEGRERRWRPKEEVGRRQGLGFTCWTCL
jgi:hypothetical protein